MKWLSENRAQPFGLIYINRPNLSHSKSIRDVPDVQRDYVNLIRAAAVLLKPDGALIFSTHLRRFNLDRARLAELTVEDMSRQTLCVDFVRRPQSHHCFCIAYQNG